MMIRKETPDDIESISAVTIAAFKDHPVSQHNEQYIISALRYSKALTISLVAAIDDKIVGHIAFSPATISDGTKHWYGLGPVSVAPDYQKQGIGRKLIETGLAELKAIGAQGCSLVGDPDFYQKLAFKHTPHLIYEGIPQNYFLTYSFIEKEVTGHFEFHSSFKATSSVQ